MRGVDCGSLFAMSVGSAFGPGRVGSESTVHQPASMTDRGPLGIPYPWAALAVVCISVFLGTMDMSLVNIALPVLATEFDADTNAVIWVSLAFVLTSTSLALLMGRLADVYGRRRIFLIGSIIFAGGMAASAAAGSLLLLVVARTIQAVGSAMLISNGNAIVTAAVPEHRRAQSLGFVGAAVGAGLATGPVLGGLLLGVFDWRALFWARLPLAILIVILVARVLRETPADERARGLDITGSAILVAMLVSLTLGINRGNAWGWSSPAIVALLAGGVALVATFIVVERRAASPVVALDLFRNRAYSAAIGSSMLLFIGVASVMILMPFYLLDIRNYSAIEAGGVMAAQPIALLIFAPIVGRVADRVGARVPATLGVAVVAACLFALTTLDTTTSLVAIVPLLGLMGFGMALFQSPNNASVMSSVPPQRLGTASASISTARTIGQSTGMAIAGAVHIGQAAAYAAERSPLGLDDPAIRPDALVSGLELALVVGAAVAAAGVLVSWLRGSRATPADARRAAEARVQRRAPEGAPAGDGR